MRKALAWVVGIGLVASLAACGDKSGGGGGGSSGVEGTWEVNLDALVDAVTAEQVKGNPAMSKPEVIDGMKKATRAMMSSMKVEVNFKSDHTVTMDMSGMPQQEPEHLISSWSQSGDQVTVTPKTKNGKPVEGEDAKVVTMTQKGNTIMFKPDPTKPMEFVLNRK